MRINAVAVQGIAAACAETGAALLHYSTDHVFRGDKKTPYTEQDRPQPPSAYAISKLAGELFARAYCEKQYVVRVAGVFGPAGRYTNHGNFPELILRKADERTAIRIVKDFVATPTYGPALAARSIDLLEKKIPYGLYHLGGGEEISWHDYALKIAEAAGKEADISAVTHREYPTAAKRAPLCRALERQDRGAGHLAHACSGGLPRRIHGPAQARTAAAALNGRHFRAPAAAGAAPRRALSRFHAAAPCARCRIRRFPSPAGASRPGPGSCRRPC